MHGETPTSPTAVVFDVGGVLIDWDPRHLYVNIIADPRTRERFLAEVCTMEWHLQHDLGLSFSETIPPLVEAHPQWEREIRAWGERFSEMWKGPIEGTVELLKALKDRGIPLYASTNWGAENWTLAKELFPFLSWFDGALVSGEVGMLKPDPAFFALLIRRFGLDPSSTLYIDDAVPNLEVARVKGFLIHHFENPVELASALDHYGLLDPPSR